MVSAATVRGRTTIFLVVFWVAFFYLLKLKTYPERADFSLEAPRPEGGKEDESLPTAPSHPRRNTIVMARTKDQDVSWVTNELISWDASIYTVNDPEAPLQTPKNKGKEGMAYLTYILDNYHNLPNISVFLHAHRDGYPQAWHTDVAGYSNVKSVNTLRLDTVRDRGYVNLRCNWVPGCPDEVQPFRTADEDRHSEHVFADAWAAMFGESLPVPEVIGVPCCAQFAVSKEQILKREKSEYDTYRNWLLDTPLDDDISGRILEYLWHIFFGAPAVFCPALHTCYCDVYGHGC